MRPFHFVQYALLIESVVFQKAETELRGRNVHAPEWLSTHTCTHPVSVTQKRFSQTLNVVIPNPLECYQCGFTPYMKWKLLEFESDSF